MITVLLAFTLPLRHILRQQDLGPTRGLSSLPLDNNRGLAAAPYPKPLSSYLEDVNRLLGLGFKKRKYFEVLPDNESAFDELALQNERKFWGQGRQAGCRDGSTISPSVTTAGWEEAQDTGTARISMVEECQGNHGHHAWPLTNSRGLPPLEATRAPAPGRGNQNKEGMRLA